MASGFRSGNLLVAVFSVLLLTTGSSRAADRFDLNGYYKNFFVDFRPVTIPGFGTAYPSDDLGMVTNRLRLKMEYRITDGIKFHGAYNFVPRIQDPALLNQSLLLSSLDQSPYRVTDPARRLYPSKEKKVRSFALLQNIDRADFSFALPFADVYVGRQAIAFGMARVINPTDIIAPFTFQDLDTEERSGVDAVRIRMPQGFMSELDIGYVAGRHFQWNKSAVFVREKTYFMETDISMMLIRFHKHLMAGVNLARSVGGAGAWLEAAYTLAKPFTNGAFENIDNYFRGSVGMDYNFNSKTYGFIEYHYNDPGAKQPENYIWNLYPTPSIAYRDGAVYLLGKQYLAPGINYQITALITLTGQALYNIGDHSIFFAPQIEYNISQNIYIGGGGFISFGKSPKAGGSTDNPFPYLRSEFGAYPDIYYTDFRIYF